MGKKKGRNENERERRNNPGNPDRPVSQLVAAEGKQKIKPAGILATVTLYTKT